MGIYAKFRDKLPPKPLTQEGGFAEKVEKQKEAYAGQDRQALCAEFLQARTVKNNLEEQLKITNIHIEAMNQLLVGRMEDEGLEKLTTAEGVTLFIQDEPQCSVADKPKLFKWIKRTKSAYLLNVQWQTLNALVKELLVAGKPAPPGVEVFISTKVRARVAGNGKSSAEKGEEE